MRNTATSFKWANNHASCTEPFRKDQAYKVCYRREKGTLYLICESRFDDLFNSSRLLIFNLFFVKVSIALGMCGVAYMYGNDVASVERYIAGVYIATRICGGFDEVLLTNYLFL